ncbi:hypothetical protein [Nocardia thraciensis]
MPVSIALAVVLQLLLAATMIVMPVVAWIRGGRAQLAAEQAVVRQGCAPEMLAEHGIRLEEKVWEFALALGIAAVLITLAILNITGTARVVSLVAEPVLLLAVGSVTTSQVFAARYTQAAFRKSGDPAVRAIDARAVIEAAGSEFPSWLRPLVLTRFALATAGSLATIVLLLTPAASAWFH